MLDYADINVLAFFVYYQDLFVIKLAAMTPFQIQSQETAGKTFRVSSKICLVPYKNMNGLKYF